MQSAQKGLPIGWFSLTNSMPLFGITSQQTVEKARRKEYSHVPERLKRIEKRLIEFAAPHSEHSTGRKHNALV